MRAAPEQCLAQYIALGDSISIDDYPGPGLGAASLLYRNRDDLYPEFRGRDILSVWPRATFHPFCFDGATTESVLQRQCAALPPDVPERTIVTLTVGGNDLLAMLGVRAVDGAGAVDSIAGAVGRIVRVVRRRYGDPLVIVGTIYDPTDGVGDLSFLGVPAIETLALLGAANAAIADAAGREGALVADIHAHFLGHGSHHADPSNAHYRAEDPTDWLVCDIEPNPRGASEVRRLFWGALARAGGLP